MSQSRKQHAGEPTMPPPPRPAANTLLAAETLRKCAEVTVPEPAPAAAAPKGEERISLFWRIFGGTLLSIAALVIMTVYQQFSANIADLRAGITHLNEVDAQTVKKDELNEVRASVTHLNEVHADMVRKDDVNARTTALWGAIKETGSEVPNLKTRETILETQLKAVEDERKELQKEVQALRERVIGLEGRQAAAPAKGDGH
jgi:uncharacterized protein (DUF3084 family)